MKDFLIKIQGANAVTIKAATLPICHPENLKESIFNKTEKLHVIIHKTF